MNVEQVVATTSAVSGVVTEGLSKDPLYQGLAFVLAILVIAIGISKPLMSLVREYKQTNVEASKANAETSLFVQLQTQISANTISIETLIREKNESIMKSLHLAHEVERLRGFEAGFEQLKQELQSKASLLDAREAEIRNLVNTILQLKDGLHSLEMRVLQDERRCVHCAKMRLSRAEDREFVDSVVAEARIGTVPVRETDVFGKEGYEISTGS